MADVTMNATMKTTYTTYTVYFGPGGAGTFEKVGSVSAGEKVRVNWREGTYSNITYVVTPLENTRQVMSRPSMFPVMQVLMIELMKLTTL